ncbi:hypothetical protein OSH39_16790 [Mycobacterium ulcerans]|uniref:Conserved transmembrane protein n=4 Tax=Mycobacterium ulcerans group TaxID=2993898 RepID=B2HMW8_MYCMM|nr:MULTISPECIES: hypothetical protein [Mycobacterium]ABL03680.1 conserved transmembrane protein [Mycobacterium ulcerans Agy99]ACC38907.1 conserved transmembrane protein [Mycobacterium marinum M]AGC60533.1 conserved transmembrane protein [Mycobacterium liflandii 128FXT]AXN42363.1 hypothetical protein MM1218R_00408 [Mycobacterium marinum]AXN47831.1 hypothetical protein CCUG20998_00407 [Mycobacterium marinum]
MRNAWRLAAFDILAPLVAIAALVMIGFILGWPWWWISACSVLVLLVLEGVAVNFWLFRRDAVTVGTDDEAPGLRLAVVFLCTAALVAAVLTGYTHWTSPDRDFNRDSRRVVAIATGMAEAVASFSPGAPNASADRAAAMMVPERVAEFKAQYAKSSADLVQHKITAQADTLSAGVEALGPSAASVAVILRVTQNSPGQPPSQAAPALRVSLTKRGNDWLVLDVVPINSR